MSVPAPYEVIAFNTAASSDTYRIIVCLAPGIMKTQQFEAMAVLR